MPKPSMRMVRDLAVVCIVVVVALLVAVRFEAFESFERWAQTYETWQVDELIVVPVVLAITFVAYSWRRQRELEESEERFRSLVQHASDVSLIMAADRTVHFISPAVERVLGYKPEDLIGQNNYSSVHPDDMPRVQDVVAEAVKNPGTTFPLEVRLRHADGSWRHLESRCTSLLDDPAVGGIVFNSRDITERKRAEEKRREAEERYRTLVERIPAITYIQEATNANTLTYVSPQIKEILGYDPEECTSDPEHWKKILHPDDRERVLAEDRRTNETGEPFSMEYRQFAKDGRVVWLRDEAALVRDEEGNPSYWLGIQTDMTEHKEAEEALRRSEASLAEAQRMANLGNWEWDVKSGEVWWSEEVFRIYGSEPGEFTPSLERLMEVVHPDDRELIRHKIDNAIYEGEPYDFEHRIVRPDGEVRVVHRRAEVVRGEGGEPLKMVGTVHDITERKALEVQLEHRASHDPLTGLPNRKLLMDRLERALARAQQRGSTVAVLFMDLDDLKVINDSLGHEAGDKLLVAVGWRLRACLRPGDTAARFGGDEFVIMLEDTSAGEASRVAERLVERMRTFFALNGRELTITCSIGIALGGSARERPDDLLRRADMALYEAKVGGKNRYGVFEEEMEASASERLEKEHSLRKTIERKEGFVVHYQPVVSVGDGRIVGFEALVRWSHPWRGLLLPREFLSLAEQTGVVIGIGQWVLGEVCHQAKEWHERYPSDPPLTVSVNLSARQLAHPGLVEDVAQALKRYKLEPHSLVLEVTENTMMEDVDASGAILRRLKDLGVRIAVDDFGKGYSSLSYLKRLPVDILKIDRSFVDGLGTDQKDEGIVRAVIDLARTLGLEVVAEGLETGEQLAHLREMECELAQGFYFWEPLPAERGDELLATYNYP